MRRTFPTMEQQLLLPAALDMTPSRTRPAYEIFDVGASWTSRPSPPATGGKARSGIRPYHAKPGQGRSTASHGPSSRIALRLQLVLLAANSDARQDHLRLTKDRIWRRLAEPVAGAGAWPAGYLNFRGAGRHQGEGQRTGHKAMSYGRMRDLAGLRLAGEGTMTWTAATQRQARG